MAAVFLAISGSRRRAALSSLGIPRTRSIGEVTAGMMTGAPSAMVDRGLAAHDLEGAAGNRLQLIQVLVVPAMIGAAAEEPVGAVVGDDEPVLLHRHRDRMGGAVDAGDVVAGLEPQPQPHRRRVRAVG